MPNVKSPSVHQHAVIQNAYHYFNKRLFGGKLTTCMINFSRKAKMLGFYHASVWANGEKVKPEITMNPDAMHRPLVEVYSTLVHEMVHHWQEMQGTAPRKGYHDMQWSEEMIRIGLHPVACDGSGRMTGQKMSHSIEPGGMFDRAFQEMGDRFLLPYLPLSLEKKTKEKKPTVSKVKYTCPCCDANAWGKDGLNIGCMDCDEKMIQQSD